MATTSKAAVSAERKERGLRALFSGQDITTDRPIRHQVAKTLVELIHDLFHVCDSYGLDLSSYISAATGYYREECGLPIDATTAAEDGRNGGSYIVKNRVAADRPRGAKADNRGLGAPGPAAGPGPMPSASPGAGEPAPWELGNDRCEDIL